jgi:Cupin domain.
MQIIDKALLDRVSEQAQNSPRLRMNFNFHEGDASFSQRLLNALEPGTVMPVHRHRHTAETYVLLRGRLKVMFYNDKREITESVMLDAAGDKVGLNIPVGQWHSLEVLESGSIIYETKDGPYAPLTDEDILK